MDSRIRHYPVWATKIAIRPANPSAQHEPKVIRGQQHNRPFSSAFAILAAQIAYFRRSDDGTSVGGAAAQQQLDGAASYWMSSAAGTAATAATQELNGNGGGGSFDEDSGVGTEVGANSSSPLSINGNCAYSTAGSDDANVMKPSRPSVCSGCYKQISDRFILRVHPNLEFHADCLKCTDCGRQLDERCTAFVRNNKTYCKDDYLRLFGRKCDRCDMQFDRLDLVMRARNLVFHKQCFKCMSCDKPLTHGEQFFIRDNDISCRIDCYP
ncbi:ISL LIM homeobox 1, partial [Aphelenchoides avenae]